MDKIFFVPILIVLILAIVLLTFRIQGISSGQLPVPPDKIHDDSTQYVVWIVTHEGGGASGTLIDKEQKFVITNAHVVGDDKEARVFFAVRDSSGEIV